MNAATHLVRPTTVEQTTGRVTRVEGATVAVRTGHGEVIANRAASCLLEPTAGDLVLLASVSTGESYVLGVLERENDGPARLSFEKDVELHTPGQLSLHGVNGVRLVSDGALSLLGRSLDAVAREGTLLLRSLHVVSQAVQADTGKLKFLAQVVESTVDRLSARFGNVYRRVDELEQVQAGQVQMRVDGNLDLRGGNTLVTAERLVKVNAEQVHMG